MAIANFSKKIKSFLIKVSVLGFFVLLFLTIYLDSKVKNAFDQQAWEIPAKVYARPLNFSIGQALSISDLVKELKLLGYRKKIKATSNGEYEQYQNTFVINTRPFNFWDGGQSSQTIQLSIENQQVSQLIDFSSQQAINFLRLDPLLLGNIQVNPNRTAEDRQLVTLESLPSHFVSALLVSEDRDFYEHWGVSIKGTARALWRNISAGEITQGGSTLTQQLMKNHFLSNERSLWRKGQEAIMSVLTELHYDKKVILQAYINEVYLGQHRNTAIHGFARASEFYFDRKLSQLSLPQIALLVGMVKGPSYYNPRRFPERAKQRRDLVLKQMLDHGLVDQQSYDDALKRSLTVVAKPPIRTSKVPAFMGVVKKELADDYSASQLNKAGLKLFTSLNPLIQQQAETALSQRLAKIDKGKGDLQGAVVVTQISSGEILAVVGDRNPNYIGFNRALDAYRQTGSVIKPFVYLTALQRPESFHLMTPIKDQRFSLTGTDGSTWSPENYDREEHGDENSNVPLQEGLINSYNLATAKLAMTVGIERVADTIKQAGFDRELPAYPSIALGSKEMSPLEVLKLYQTIANQGVAVEPQALIAVQDQFGNLLTRYPRKSQQVIDSEAAYLIRHLLSQVTSRGTAKSLAWQFPEQTLAGKTGTTNDLRDSWFAGFDNSKLAVVWVGRDDNQPTGLTGASGASKVWADLFKAFGAETIQMTAPEGIEFGYQSGGFLSSFTNCKTKDLVPFYQSQIPPKFKICD
ncbi:MAG: penicillin-binding protein 1B [Kangiellaceae bacterium]